MSTGKWLQTLQTFVVPSLARSGRLRRVVLLELLDPTFTLSHNPEGLDIQIFKLLFIITEL
jgi:hypothetical protein